MKWFKHHADEDREFLDLLQDELNHEGYSVYYQVVEALATAIEREIEAFRLGQTDFIRPIMTVSCKWLAKRCRTTPEFLKKLMGFCRDSGRWSIAKLGGAGQDVTIEMPKLLSDSDEYFADAIRGACKKRGIPREAVLKLSGDSPEKLPRVSGDSPETLQTEKTRTDRQDKRTQDQNNKPRPPSPAPESDAAGGLGGAGPSSPRPTPPQVAVPAHVEHSPSEVVLVPRDELELPQYALAMVLLLPLQLEPGLAGQYAARFPVRVIAAAARDAGSKARHNPGGYVRTLLEKRWRTLSPISEPHARQLRTQLAALNLEQAERGKALLSNAKSYDSAPFQRRPGEAESAFRERVLGIVGATPSGPAVREARA